MIFDAVNHYSFFCCHYFLGRLIKCCHLGWICFIIILCPFSCTLSVKSCVDHREVNCLVFIRNISVYSYLSVLINKRLECYNALSFEKRSIKSKFKVYISVSRFSLERLLCSNRVSVCIKKFLSVNCRCLDEVSVCILP